jgi:hypothetical protein
MNTNTNTNTNRKELGRIDGTAYAMEQLSNSIWERFTTNAIRYGRDGKAILEAVNNQTVIKYEDEEIQDLIRMHGEFRSYFVNYVADMREEGYAPRQMYFYKWYYDIGESIVCNAMTIVYFLEDKMKTANKMETTK